MARAARAMASGTVLRTTLIGLGRIGWSLELDPLRYHPCTHAGTLRHMSRGKVRFRVASVCDTKAEQLARFQRWWPSMAIASQSHSEALATPELDLAIVAVSLEQHLIVAGEAIRRGIPRLLLEKPAAATAAGAARLLRLARQHGTTVWVNFERRTHPAYRFVKHVLEQATLGPLRSIRGRVLTGTPAPSAPVGPLVHDAVHWIDLLLWFAGKPRRTSARVMRQKGHAAEHTTFVRFDYADFTATLETGGRRGYFEFEMELDFAEGRLVVGNEGLRAWRSRSSRRYQNFRDLSAWKPTISAANPWVRLYNEILQGPVGGVPSASLADAVTGLRLIEEISSQT